MLAGRRRSCRVPKSGVLPAVGDRCPAAPEIPFPISNPGVEDRAPRLRVHVSLPSHSISNADTVCRYRHNQLRFSHRPLLAATQAAHARCVLGQGSGCWGNAIPLLTNFWNVGGESDGLGVACTGTSGAKCIGTPLLSAECGRKVQARPALVLAVRRSDQGPKELGELPLICWTVDRASIQ